jgi:hypothetical protein
MEVQILPWEPIRVFLSMWPGADTTTTGHYGAQWPYETTRVSICWSSHEEKVKEPWTLAAFIAKKKRITEAWHVPFEVELMKWRRCGQTLTTLNHFLYRQTVEYVVRTWLSVDWRWVFKRWVQELYAT